MPVRAEMAAPGDVAVTLIDGILATAVIVLPWLSTLVWAGRGPASYRPQIGLWQLTWGFWVPRLRARRPFDRTSTAVSISGP
jgi:hypothetical protein